MTGASSIPAFRGSIDDEGVGALEQESFVRGSSDFRPNLTATGLESTLNHWVVFSLIIYMCAPASVSVCVYSYFLCSRIKRLCNLKHAQDSG